MNYEKSYLALCQNVLDNGEYTGDRTGTGTYSLFGGMIRHDMSNGFPLLTTKKINFGLVAGELLWFLGGFTDLVTLRHFQNKPKGAHTIWTDDFKKYWEMSDNDFAKYEKQGEDGGRIYGDQWRNYYSESPNGEPMCHDQIETLLKNITDVKNGKLYQARRLIVNAWNPYDHTDGEKVVSALSACHDSFQCLVRGNKLHLRFHCRSNDMFLGNPYNMASYGLLLHILAKLTGLEVGELVYFGTDVHLYTNHVDQIKEQMGREPKPLPKIIMPEFETLEDLLKLTGEDFKLEGYDPHAFIKAPQAS